MAKQCLFEPCFGKKKEWKTCGIVGIRTLISRNKERGDAIHIQLESLLASDGDSASVSCHKSCYSLYTSVSRNVSGSNKRKPSGLLSCEEPPERVSRSQVPEFVFKQDCLFCGETCVPKNLKNPGRWVPVSQCETETRPSQPRFKQVILDICDDHRDDLSREVEVRVNGAQTDLPAVYLLGTTGENLN